MVGGAGVPEMSKPLGMGNWMVCLTAGFAVFWMSVGRFAAWGADPIGGDGALNSEVGGKRSRPFMLRECPGRRPFG